MVFGGFVRNFIALGTRQTRRLAARRISTFLVLLSLLGMQFAPSAFAGNLYWDTNDIADGSGAATGIWGTSVFWNTDPTGGALGSFTATTTSADDLFFSAGTNGTAGTVTVSTGQSADSITFQNNVALTLSGGTLTLGGGATPGIFVLPGDNAANVISTPITLNSASNAFNFTNGGTGLLTIGAMTGAATSGTQLLNVSSASTGGITLNGIIGNGAAGGNVGLVVNNTSTGVTTLSGVNTYTGGTTINGGKVIITADANLGAVTGPLTINGGTLQENTSFNMSASRQIIIGAAGATFNENATGANFNIGGVIKDAVGGGGALFITGTGAGIYVPVAQNTYTGGTHLGLGTTSVANSDSIGSASTGNLVSGPYGTGTLFLDGGKMRAPTGTTGLLIGNAIQMTADTTFVTGSPNVLTLSGPVQLVGGTRTITQSSAADVVLSGAISDGGNGNGLTVNATSTGSLVLGGVNTYSGPTTINMGNVVLNATADLASSSAINVGLVGTGGSLNVKGSHTFSGALTVGGNATAANAGTLNLLDNSVNTITLNPSNPSSPALVLGGASAGDASNLNFDLGASGTDKIVLGAGAQAQVNAGGARVNVNVLGGYTGASSVLISSPTTDLTTGGPIALDTTTGNFGGFVLNATTTATAVTIAGTKLVTTTPDTLYFKGGIDGKWNGFAGGNLNNSNWTTDAAGTIDPHTYPAANTDVHFSATGFTAANQSTTLNQDFSIKSLTMDATATTAVTIAPGITQPGTLTIGAGGITSQAGAAALTVSAPVVLGTSQTWMNNSANALTVSGALSGTANLTIAQPNPAITSSIQLDGNNTALNGNITISSGRLDARNTGTTNVINALGANGVFLNGGTLGLRANGSGNAQTIVTGDGVTGNDVTIGGNTTIDVQHTSGANVGSTIVLNNLVIGANTLNVTGASTSNYSVNIAGNTTLNGAATLNATTAGLTLLGKVTDNGNNLSITGAAPTRLRNTAAGAGANMIAGTLNVAGVVQGYIPAAGAAAAGSNSLGAATTIALNSSAAVLRLTPSFDGGLVTAASPGLIDKSYVVGTTLTSLALTNFLGATQPVTTGVGGQNPTGVQTVGQINIPVAVTATTTSHQFTGMIKITNAGTYNFSSLSDDGGNVFIDGNAPIVTSNTTATGSFYLTAGLHTLTNRWNNNTGNGSDVLSYQGPDTANALVVVLASVLSNTTASAMAANFGNNVTIAAGTAPTIDIAANTSLGSLTMLGTGAGTTLNVTGSGDVNTLTFNGAVTLTDNFTLTDPTAHVVFNNGLMAANGGPNNLTVTKNGFGTLTINGPVTTTGGFIVNGGIVNVTGTGTVGATGAPVTLNGGVIDLGGTSQNIGAISGTGTIQNGTLTQSTLLKQGPGTVTLGLSATPTAVVVNQGLVGTTSNPATLSTLKLDFSNAFSPSTNIVNPTATLTLGGSGVNLVGGGALALQGKASTSNSQSFASTLVDAGASSLALTAGTSGSLLLNAGPITRNVGGTLDVTLPAGTQSATNGVVTSTGTAGQLLTLNGTAFATVAGNDWAAISNDIPGNIVSAAVAGPGGTSLYTTASTAATFTGNANVTATFAATTGSTVNSIRFGTGAFTLTLAGTNTVSSGGILISGTTGISAITGGTIVPGTGQELVFISNKPNVINTIGSVLADGASGATSVTYRGNLTGTTGGLFDIKSNNTYTGPTYITSGRVATQSTAVTTPFGTGPNAIVYVDGNNDGQFFSNLNTTIANPFVIIGNGLNENGTRSGAIRLNSTSAITPTLSGPITLMGDASIGNTGAITGAGSSLISGNIGTSNAAGATSFTLTKVSAGIIRLTGTNSQTATNINAGALNINTDAALGLATSPVTFTGTGTLQLASAQAVAATRNIVLNSGVTGSIDNGLGTAGASTTISGVISGAGSFAKAYATQSGATNPLFLTGANTFTGNVTATSGWLVATNSQSFGLGAKTISAVTNTGNDAIHFDPGAGPAIDLPATMSFTLSNDGQGLYLLGTNDGTVVNDSGNNIVRGNITMSSGGGGTILASKAGTITFTGNLAPNTTGRLLKLRGDGAGVISGVIANGPTIDMPVTRDLGTGAWTLSGANTYTGTTAIQNGTLKLGSAAALGGVGLTLGTTDNGTNVSGAGTLDLGGQNINEVIRLNGTGNGGTGALINIGTATSTFGGTLASLQTTTTTGLGSAPVVALSGGGGTGATATASLGVTNGTFALATGGAGYSVVATATVSGGGAATQGTVTALMGVTAATFTLNANTGYTVVPTVTFNTPTGGTAATGHFNNNSGVLSLVIDSPGSGYTAAPTATLAGGTTTGTAVTVTPTFTNLFVVGINVATPGLGYTSQPTLTFTGTATTQATGTANANNFNLQGFAITNPGTGYTSAPTATLTTGTGTNTLIPSLAGIVLTGDSSIGGTGNIVLNGQVTESGGQRALTKVGTNTLNLAGNNAYTGATTVTGGTLSVTGSIANSSGVTVNNAAATFDAVAAQTVKSLTVTAGNARVVNASKIALTVGDGTQATSQLSLTGGTLDLTTNGVAIHYAAGTDNDTAALASVRAQIIAGYNPSAPNAGDGNWKGATGITSSNAAAGSLGAVGYALAGDVLAFTNGTTDTFMGTTVDKNTVVARYTLSGDVNLDGTVDFLDLARLAQSYNVTDGTRQWSTGDVNYDGNTDFLDLAKLAQNYNTALPTEPIPGAPANFEADLARAFAAVPEPGTISILGIGALALLARRRNRKAA
jgi:fibronectin-binding autotransporter adhesin